MKLLCVGGPRHGETMPYTEGKDVFYVPEVPKLTADFSAHDVYCVHGASVLSTTYRAKVVADRLVWLWQG